MIHKHNLSTDMSKANYTSCIKIGGIPILPPLVTQKKQLELQEYKKKAIDLERRLKYERDLKLFIKQLPDVSENKILKCKEIDNKSRTVTRTLENLLTFNSEDPYVDALNITYKSSKNQKLPCGNSVPKKPSRLTCNIFDVTQYSDDGVILFNEYNKSEQLSDSDTKLSASIVELDLTSLGCTNDTCDNSCNNSKETIEETCLTEAIKENSPISADKSKPRLLRSNSYVLEAPSPVLLEHIKKQAELDTGSSHTFKKYVGQKQQSLDLGNSSTSSNESPEKLYLPCKDITENMLTDINASFSTSSSVQKEVHIRDDSLKGCDISVENISELVENLANLHFGTNKSDGFKENKSDLELVENEQREEPKSPEDLQRRGEEIQSKVIEAEVALQEVVNDMPKSCIKDIMDFLDRHRLEQELKLETYSKFKEKLLSGNVNSNHATLPKPADSDLRLVNDHIEKPKLLQPNQSEKNVLLECDEESIHFLSNSPTDTLNALNTSNSLLIDFESDSETAVYFDCKSTHHVVSSDHLNLLIGRNEYQRSSTSFKENRSGNCSRELFAATPDKIRQLKEQWAGTILTAAAKGFLVRRLKRTERARNLIQTIRDAVTCAMSLHSEDTETIQSSDVELHRRLIQQISAACYEFYDIFFGLTLKEQMIMIATDRQKLQEKLKRPRSSSSLKLEANRSTPRVQRQSLTARQKKPLTPSFAA